MGSANGVVLVTGAAGFIRVSWPGDCWIAGDACRPGGWTIISGLLMFWLEGSALARLQTHPRDSDFGNEAGCPESAAWPRPRCRSNASGQVVRLAAAEPVSTLFPRESPRGLYGYQQRRRISPNVLEGVPAVIRSVHRSSHPTSSVHGGRTKKQKRFRCMTMSTIRFRCARAAKANGCAGALLLRICGRRTRLPVLRFLHRHGPGSPRQRCFLFKGDS